MSEKWDIEISPAYPVTVPAYLNGDGPYPFVLDTGCVRGNVSQHVAESLSLDTDELGCAVLDSFAVGDLVIPEYHLCVRDNSACRPVRPSEQRDGFLGMDFLRYFEITLDCPGECLSLVSVVDSMPRTMYKPEPGFSYVRIRYPNLYVVAPVQLNDSGPYNFVLDTGSQMTLVSPELADRVGLIRGEERQSHGIEGTSRPEAVHLSEAGSLQIGAQRVEDLPVAVADCARVSSAAGMQVDGYIGHSFLEVFRIRVSVLELVMGLARQTSKARAVPDH